MNHHVDLYDIEDDFIDDNLYFEKAVNNKAKQKKNTQTRRKLESRLEARRLRKLLDDYSDY